MSLFQTLFLIILVPIFQSLFKSGACLEPHTTGNSGFHCAYNVDGGCVHLSQMAAAHHGEAMEGGEVRPEPVSVGFTAGDSLRGP